MVKVIGILNSKGGVGKTTTSISFGKCLADIGYSVLLVDCDDSGVPSLSNNLGLKPDWNKDETGLADLIDPMTRGRNFTDEMISKSVKKHPEGFDVLPSDESLADLSQNMNACTRQDKVLFLKYLIDTVKERYDYVILDGAPSKTIIQYNLYAACDEIIITTMAETPSFDEPVADLYKTIMEFKKDTSSPLEIKGMLITRFKTGSASERIKAESIENVGKALNIHVFKSRIPDDVKVPVCADFKKSVIAYKPNSRASIAYKAFTKEYVNLQ